MTAFLPLHLELLGSGPGKSFEIISGLVWSGPIKYKETLFRRGGPKVVEGYAVLPGWKVLFQV